MTRIIKDILLTVASVSVRRDAILTVSFQYNSKYLHALDGSNKAIIFNGG